MNRTKTGNRSELSYDVLGIQHVAPDSRRLFRLRTLSVAELRSNRDEADAI